MKKKITVFLSICLSLLLLIGCTNSVDTSQESDGGDKSDEVIELTYGHIQNPGHSLYIAAENFKEMVEERTNGRVKINIYPSNQLGTAREMIEQTAMGTLDITFAGTSDWASGLGIEELGVYDFPFLYEDLDAQHRLVNEILVDDIASRMEPSPVRLLNVYSNGIRNPLTKTRPITSLDDIKGMKMRTPENPLFVDTWTHLGATVVTSPWSEVYTVIQQGVADACEADAVGMINMNLQEVGEYYSKIGHMGSVYVVAINEEKWNSIPKDLQDVIMESAIENTEEQIKNRKTDDDIAEQQLRDAGVTITEIEPEERAKMIEAVRPIYDDFAEKYEMGDFIDRILELSK
ncbi:MAG: TRAP transporter substrate-binding protein [Thermotaleaceae bacterium]